MKIAAAEQDRLIADALNRLPAASRDRTLDLTSALIVEGLPAGEFSFVSAVDLSDPARVSSAFREASRLLRQQGIFFARFHGMFTIGELGEFARDLDFQILVLEGGHSSQWTKIVWRKRAAGWRTGLADHAAFAGSHIVRMVSTWDKTPVVASRGRYSAVSIEVEGLPIDMDLLDLEITTGGVRASAVSISEPDAKGLQKVVAQLPSLEQTGLIPVDLHWFGERLTSEPSYLRVVPPGPVAPRIVEVKQGVSRLACVTVSIEELARPDELTASVDGSPIWGMETRLVDAPAQIYEVRLFIPEEVPAGTHQVQLNAGRRKLAPFTVELR